MEKNFKDFVKCGTCTQDCKEETVKDPITEIIEKINDKETEGESEKCQDIQNLQT